MNEIDVGDGSWWSIWQSLREGYYLTFHKMEKKVKYIEFYLTFFLFLSNASKCYFLWHYSANFGEITLIGHGKKQIQSFFIKKKKIQSY